MGGSISTLNEKNVLSCAPRYVKIKDYGTDGTDYWYLGKCTLLDDNLKFKQNYSPCLDCKQYNCFASRWTN